MERSPEVVIDANFALVPVQFKVDIFSELDRILQGTHSLVVLSVVAEEIARIKGGRLAMEIMEKNGVKIVSTGTKNADDAIVEYAQKGKTVVCTNDKGLEKRLKAKGVPVIILRGKNRLEIRGSM